MKIKAPIHRPSSLRRAHSFRHELQNRRSMVVSLKLPAGFRAQSCRQPPSSPEQSSTLAQPSLHNEQDPTPTVTSNLPLASPRAVAEAIRQQRSLDEQTRGHLHPVTRARTKHEFSSSQLVFSSIISRAKPHGISTEGARPTSHFFGASTSDVH